MGLTRKRQLLAAVESTEGTPVTLNTTHYIDALTLGRTYPQDISDEASSSSGTLSEDLGVVGRGSCGFTFSTRYFGYDYSIRPPIDALMLACGLQYDVLPYFTVSVAPTIATWAGMTILDSSAGTATLVCPIGADLRCYYTNAQGGFPNADTTLTMQGVSGSGFTIASATPAGYGLGYRPDSLATATITLTAAGWTGTAPAVGDMITNGLDGVNSARGIVVTIAAGVLTTVEIEPLTPGRAFINGDAVAGTAAGRTGTNTIAAAGQVLTRTPSLTMKGNVGGHSVLGTGMRGNMTVNFEAGKIPIAEFTFEGSRSSTTSELPLSGVTTVSPSAISRWQSATANINGFEIPIANASITLGNTISLLSDAHGSQGVRGSSITARQISMTLDPDRTHESYFNFISRMTNGTPVSVHFMWGTAPFRMGLFIPRAQIYQQDDGDREGILTANLTVRPKQLTGSGDNEAYFQFGI